MQSEPPAFVFVGVSPPLGVLVFRAFSAAPAVPDATLIVVVVDDLGPTRGGNDIREVLGMSRALNEMPFCFLEDMDWREKRP